jgi:hypothetical protein
VRLERPFVVVRLARPAREWRRWSERARHAALATLAPPFVFHAAPREARDAIEREGLDTEQRRPWLWIDRKPGVYLWGTLFEAADNARLEFEGSGDIWAIAREGLEALPDENEMGAWRVPGPVPAHRMVCLGGPPAGRARQMDPRLERACERGWPAGEQLGRWYG